MIHLIFWFTKKEFLHSYPSYFQLIAAYISAGLSLVVYWFTARALEPAFITNPDTSSLFYGDFFSYVLLGELIISLPILLLSAPPSVIKQAIVEEQLDHWLFAQGGILRPIISNAIAICAKSSFVLYTTVILALALLELNFSFTHVFLIFFYQLALLPVFLSMGLIAVSVVIAFGRGAGAFAQLGGILTIFAGVFFPLGALPHWLQEASMLLSPYTLFTESMRKMLFSESIFLEPKTFLILFTWGVLSLILGYFLLQKSLSFRRLKGDPIVLISEE